MVDYLIVTFIREEYEAVRRHFLADAGNATLGALGVPRVADLRTRSGKSVTVAIARTPSQGNLAAQEFVHRIIEEQKPRLVLAVGIAGATPTPDIFLGDILLVGEIHDLTRGAETQAGREEAAASTHMPIGVKNFVANLATDDFREWEDYTASIERPSIDIRPTKWADDEEWNKRIDRVVSENATRKKSKIVDGVIASSDHLVKSDKFMKGRLLVDRRILANDMESVGVAKACEGSNVPLLVARSISDIVQYPRTDDWKRYACEVVARFARELVFLDAVEAIVGTASGQQITLPNDTETVIQALNSTLADIRKGVLVNRAEMCREAFELFKRLPTQLRKQWGPQLFETLDRPMKSLGDKRLVLDVANECITSCSGTDRSPEMAECEARARICGTSWAYTRLGNLGLAEEEAETSVRISHLLDSDKNLAYCMKCSGRLKRLLAEREMELEGKGALYRESERRFRRAISLFCGLKEYGPTDPEIGDCYSLLGRTYLSAGDVKSAWTSAHEARRLLIDGNSKDYLDLRILEGDLWIAESREYAKAMAAYDEVIEVTSESNYQMSEIVARAHFQKGLVLGRMGETSKADRQFAFAEEIWNHYQERDFAADAEWQRIVVSGVLTGRRIKALEHEEARVRCSAVQLFNQRQERRSRGLAAQRKGDDDAVWLNLVRQVKRNLARRTDVD